MDITPRVNSKHGAPMGRHSSGVFDAAVKVHLVRVPLNSGGYDAGGAYWGLGPPLWCAWDDETESRQYFRAKARIAAKAYVRGEWCLSAKFYR